MADYVPCATPPAKGFLASLNPLAIFDDVETLTPQEFLRDFYTRRGLYDKLEDVDALVKTYGHQMHVLYAQLDKNPESVSPYSYAVPTTPRSPVVLLGNSGVGKTNLISRLHKGEFSEQFTSTLSVEFLTHVVKVDNTDVKAQIWDTAGQERFHAMMSTYYRKTAGALLVFDVGNRASLLGIEKWLDQLLNVAEPGLHATLVGNKCDLPGDKRIVTTDEARQFAAAHHMAYVETSAKTGLNVEEAFRGLVEAIQRARLAETQEIPLASIELNGKKSSSSLFDCKVIPFLLVNPNSTLVVFATMRVASNLASIRFIELVHFNQVVDACEFTTTISHRFEQHSPIFDTSWDAGKAAPLSGIDRPCIEHTLSMTTTAPEVVYASGKDILAHGPMKFHQDIAGKVETALGHVFPRIGIRFKHVSLSADLVSLTATDSQTPNSLPTLTNQVLKSVAGISPTKHSVRKHILRDVTGSFCPGTITLVLGQSGSGKSALMKLLSGRFPMAKEITVEGEIEYDGIPREKLLTRLPQFVGYVPRNDTHLPTLTVRETFEFAHEFCGAKLSEHLESQLVHGSDNENRVAVEAARRVFQYFPDIILRSLGLTTCESTIVGNEMYRGISGGERRRTTTGEMEFGLKYVTFMDEISTGLDSAASFDIVAAQRSIAKTLNRTVVISLLQPSPEIFALFDDILLMNEGRVLYHGPTSSVKSYFASQGLVCPPEKDVADFLCELATPNQSVYETVQPNVVCSVPPKSATEFADRWVKSVLFQQLEAEAEAQEHRDEQFSSATKFMDCIPEFQQSFFASLRTLTKREAILTKRNDAFVKGRLTLVLVVGLIFGSLFYQMNLANAQVSMGVIFAASLFLGLGQDANLVPIGMLKVLLFVLFAGFIVSKNSIPDWLAWLYWLDPVAWTVRSIAVSQYRSSELDVCVYKGVDYCSMYGQTMGEYSLGLFDVPSEKVWVVYGVVYLVATYFVAMTISCFVLEYHRYERPENVVLPHETSNMVSEEAAYNLISSPQASASMNDFSNDDVLVGIKAGHQANTPPVTIAFKDLWYTVSVPGGRGQAAKEVELLKSVTGYALPGTMTALMGSTGAGKTTLMDVIAGRKTAGTVKGDILINGFPATDLSIRRCTGYCEQTDVHPTASTFREALTFSAFLRQDSTVPDSVKYNTVEECLELLGLEDIADNIIRGSSMEKMKRLTIGVEMAAQPSVLFLDEPTSGLDASSAKLIMDGVRRVADSGRTVLCTIHQPSSDVFFLFDKLLLLKRGGETVYFGDLGHRGNSIVQYFESIPSVPRIDKGYNPATWMLEVIGAGVDSHRKAEPSATRPPSGSHEPAHTTSCDFVSIFNTSSSKALLDNKLVEHGIFLPSTDMEPLNYAGKRAANNTVQLQFLLKRFFTTYWRTPSYNLTRLGISLLLGFIFGVVYVGSEYDTYQGINSGLGMVYLSTMFIALVSFMSGLPLVYEERSVFYRERAAQTYNSAWFFLSFSLVEIPYVLVGALLFTVVYYPMVGLGGFPEAALYWINLALLILFEAYLVQLAMFSASTMELATILGVLINSFGLMLTGFNPPALQIPAGYKWVYDIVPHRYTFSVLVAIVFGDCSDAQLDEIALAATNTTSASNSDLSSYPLGCRVVQNAPASVGEVPIKMYVDEVFGVKHEHIGEYIATFAAILLVFRLLTAAAMRFVNHQQR
ncbi:unnamed protein product [Phytophthora fragariaefolia]|uniref:Unnamed protein product n=1 Tax=Phytophthora fragariaefolia TaxID=1490495 RepID=A0A9W6Y1Y3_9STRA|nr:unnamed protein product [Phytophthora fragariaefolia]